MNRESALFLIVAFLIAGCVKGCETVWDPATIKADAEARVLLMSAHCEDKK